MIRGKGTLYKHPIPGGKVKTKMNELLGIGMGIGALLGLAHAIGVYRSRTKTGHGAGVVGRHARGLYCAIWTLGLWTVFGPYVVAIWVIAAPVYLAHRLRRRQCALPVPDRREAL